MNVFITGGLGQIGSHIAELLLERGDSVFVIDNLETGRKEHLEPHENLTIIIDTISNRKLIFDIVGKNNFDVIIHTAASYKDPNNWYEDTMTNCVGGSNVIDAAKTFNVQRFIYFQTALCYGQKPVENPITINHPINSSGSSYSITKTANELYLHLSGINYVTFRLANVIGPRNVAGPLPIFYKRLKEGKQCFVTKSRRDFVFVKDLARTVLKACDGIGNGSYHFSSGKDILIKDLYDEIINVMGVSNSPDVEIRELGEDDVYSILLDPSKTFQDFGAIEFTPINMIVKEAIEYFNQYGTLGEYTHLNLNQNS